MKKISIPKTSQEQSSGGKGKTPSLKNNTKSLKTRHECSQLNCRAFDSTSSDSDMDERMRTKATRFFKAFPKPSTSKDQTSSSETNRSDQSDTGEAKSAKYSTELAKNIPLSKNTVRSPNISREKTPSDKKRVTGKSLVAKANVCSYSNTGVVNFNASINTSQYHLAQNQSVNVVSYNQFNKTTEERLSIKSKTYTNCIEICSSSNSEESSSESETSKSPVNYLGDHSMSTSTQLERRHQVVPPTNQTDKATASKPNRPFKSYPEDPLAITIGFDTAKMAVSGGKPENYDEFRRRMLGSKHTEQSGVNSNMRRFYASQRSDNLYREKRKKNNMAAKRSRDARRVKEDELAIRCAYLEQENMFLKKKVSELEQERAKLKAQWKAMISK